MSGLRKSSLLHRMNWWPGRFLGHRRVEFTGQPHGAYSGHPGNMSWTQTAQRVESTSKIRNDSNSSRLDAFMESRKYTVDMFENTGTSFFVDDWGFLFPLSLLVIWIFRGEQIEFFQCIHMQLCTVLPSFVSPLFSVTDAPSFSFLTILMKPFSPLIYFPAVGGFLVLFDFFSPKK